VVVPPPRSQDRDQGLYRHVFAPPPRGQARGCTASQNQDQGLRGVGRYSGTEEEAETRQALEEARWEAGQAREAREAAEERARLAEEQVEAAQGALLGLSRALKDKDRHLAGLQVRTCVCVCVCVCVCPRARVRACVRCKIAL
jgi:hypothetical protein